MPPAPEPAEPGLPTGALELRARITIASNATFLASIGETAVVYKPVSGERPLWDFPDGTLADREAAAYLVSQSFGWNIVPRTWLRDGPLGEGMVQLWQEVDPEQDAVDLILTDELPERGYRAVFEGSDEQDRPVTLVHEDSAVLRRMAVFDAVVNNADRKGGHVLEMADGHRFGIDHGLTFNVDPKLRTVLWGWLGEKLSAEEVAGVDRVRADLDGGLGASLAPLLTGEEIEVFAERCDRLRSRARFPAPDGFMPATPYPLF